MIRVFLLDDHEVVRRGLTALLESAPDITVVGESGSAQEATRIIPALRPDVAVLDARLPDGDGVTVCREVRSIDPGIKALMLTSYQDDEALFDSIMAGASGYLLKQVRGTDVVEAIRTVAAGRSLLDPNVTQQVLERLRHPDGHDPVEFAMLTPQERRILDLIAQGMTNRQIADRAAPGREDRQELRVEPARQARRRTPYPGGDPREQAPRDLTAGSAIEFSPKVCPGLWGRTRKGPFPAGLRGATTNVPARRSARRRMFDSPLLRPPSGMPRPSSSTSSLRVATSTLRSTCTEDAPACRATLVSASRSTARRSSSELCRDEVLDRSRQAQRGLEAQGRRDVGEHVEEPRPRTPPPLLRHALQLEDGVADLADRVVDVTDRTGDPVSGAARREAGGHALERQARGEEPLDHVVVQVRGDPLALLEHERSLLLGTRLARVRSRGRPGSRSRRPSAGPRRRRRAGPRAGPPPGRRARGAEPSSGITSRGPRSGASDTAGASPLISCREDTRSGSPRRKTRPASVPANGRDSPDSVSAPSPTATSMDSSSPPSSAGSRTVDACPPPRAGGSARRSSSAAPAGPPGPPPAAHG